MVSAEVESLHILDTLPERTFDDLARLAASIAGTPIAAISFLDGARLWFKATVGLRMAETPSANAPCAHTLASEAPLIVPDATQDPRFADCPIVMGVPHMRAYAGVPLLCNGRAVGTICVMDTIAREFSAEQQEALLALSGLVMEQLALRRKTVEFARSNRARNRVLADIRHAVEGGQFLLHYQPIVEVHRGTIQGLEALLRWNNPVRGLIGPTDFLPILEDSGLIVDVENWVLRRAADDYRQWLSRGVTAPRIVVNVSPQQLQSENFLGNLELALDPDGASPVPLDIEINESVILDGTDHVVRTLREVQRMGVQVTIDDFGTGYSALRHLAHLPVDMLKIDRSFIANMTENPDDMELVSSIIALAHGLSLSVAAKGVETEEQRKLLQLLRCDHMQGFLFSVALSREAVEPVLLEDQARATNAWQRLLLRETAHA